MSKKKKNTKGNNNSQVYNKNKNKSNPQKSMKKGKGNFRNKPVKISEVAPYGKMSLTRYSYEAWMKCYPDSNYDEWEYSTEPTSLLEYIAGQMERLEKEQNIIYDELPTKVVVLDDEYFEWIGQKTNTSDMRAEYAKYVSEEDALRLAKKNNLHYSYELYLYPVLLFKTAMRKNMILTRNTQMEFIKYLKQISPTLDIYALPYVLTISDIDERYDEAINMAKTYFETGIHIEHDEWVLRKNNCKNRLDMYFIPVVTRETHDSMVLIPEEMISDENVLTRALDMITMNREGLNKEGLKSVQPLAKTKFANSVKNDLNIMLPNDELYHFLINTWEVYDCYEEFVEEVNECFGAQNFD